MKNAACPVSSCLAAYAVLFLTCDGAIAQSRIDDFESSVSGTASGMTASLVTKTPAQPYGTNGVTSGSHALQLQWGHGGVRYPEITFTPSAALDWGDYTGMLVDLKNPGAEDLTVLIRVDDTGTGSRNATIVVPAGQAMTVDLTFELLNNFVRLADLWSMKALPGASSGVRSLGTWGPASFSQSTIRDYCITLNTAGLISGATLQVDNVRLTTVFPCPNIPSSYSYAYNPFSSFNFVETTIGHFETAGDLSDVTASSAATAALGTAWYTEGTHSLQGHFPVSSGYPTLTLEPPLGDDDAPESADWSGAYAFEADVHNPNATTAAPFDIRIDDPLGGGSAPDSRVAVATLAAGATATYVIPLASAQGLGQSGKIDLAAGSGVYGTAFDRTHIIDYRLFASKPTSALDLQIDNVRLVSFPSLMHAVDAYGQYSWAEFSRKAHATSDLTGQRTAEESTFTHPYLATIDTYGGWTGAHTQSLGTTGYFHTAQATDGRWWLATPLGNPFFSMGMNNVSYDGSTLALTTGTFSRSSLFAALPVTSDPYWGTYKGTSTYDYYRANLGRKYGSYGTDPVVTWTKTAISRLQLWGFNTVGNWSRTLSVTSNFNSMPTNMPYTSSLAIDLSGVAAGTSSVDLVGAMADPWDANFSSAVQAACNAIPTVQITDPYLLGYFSGNELPWGNSAANVDADHYVLASQAMALASSASPAKTALYNQVYATYSGSIASLNAAWGTSFANWTVFCAPTILGAFTTGMKTDMSLFLTSYADKYFSVVHSKLHLRDPNHLYLGCRFNVYTTEAVNKAASYCDVVSFNIYEETLQGAQWAFLDDLPVPAMVSEFQFGSLDRGMFGAGLLPASLSQTDRALRSANYVASVLDHPNMVGCHWFQYLDEPLLGRPSDGENYQIGFVSITDNPYPEMAGAVQGVMSTLYTDQLP